MLFVPSPEVDSVVQGVASLSTQPETVVEGSVVVHCDHLGVTRILDAYFGASLADVRFLRVAHQTMDDQN